MEMTYRHAIDIQEAQIMHDWDTKSPLNINPPQRGKEAP